LALSNRNATVVGSVIHSKSVTYGLAHLLMSRPREIFLAT